MRFKLTIAILILLNGCSTTSRVPSWGTSATLFPGWGKVKAAAIDNVTAPEVWAPLVGAGLLQIGEADQSVSDWASTQTPLFGSQRNAKRAGEALVQASTATYVASALAIPIGPNRTAGLSGKANGIAFGLFAIRSTKSATDALKAAVGRERPDGSSARSFPSSVASIASAQFTLTERNVRQLGVSPGVQRMARLGTDALAYTAGWARVEAKRHFLSDVLVGEALGHFVAGFFNDAFIASPTIDVQTSFIPGEGGVTAAVEFSF